MRLSAIEGSILETDYLGILPSFGFNFKQKMFWAQQKTGFKNLLHLLIAHIFIAF